MAIYKLPLVPVGSLKIARVPVFLKIYIFIGFSLLQIFFTGKL